MSFHLILSLLSSFLHPMSQFKTTYASILMRYLCGQDEIMDHLFGNFRPLYFLIFRKVKEEIAPSLHWFRNPLR